MNITVRSSEKIDNNLLISITNNFYTIYEIWYNYRHYIENIKNLKKLTLCIDYVLIHIKY